jgi:uncharacterized membrane protein
MPRRDNEVDDRFEDDDNDPRSRPRSAAQDQERTARRDDDADDDERIDHRIRTLRRKSRYSERDLRQIAIYQKALLVCVLLYILVILGSLFIPQDVRWVILIPAVPVALGAMASVFLLATKVYNVALGIFLGLLTLVPILGLVMLLVINSAATSALQTSGIRVGFLGASLSDFD